MAGMRAVRRARCLGSRVLTGVLSVVVVAIVFGAVGVALVALGLVP